VANRITVGTYSGVITGAFEPTERLAVGAYRGMSNVRLMQSSSLSPLHIASSSPHGTSTLSLVSTLIFPTPLFIYSFSSLLSGTWRI
jgi:hypothetical protein